MGKGAPAMFREPPGALLPSNRLSEFARSPMTG